MNYVEYLDLFGVQAKQIPCDTGEGPPTSSTKGAVGCLYMDTLTGAMYKCVAASNEGYEWQNAGNDALSDLTGNPGQVLGFNQNGDLSAAD